MVTGDLAAGAMLVAPRDGTTRRRSGARAPRLRARVAPRDRRRAARLGPHPEVPVSQPAAHGPRRPRRARRGRCFRETLVDYASGRLSYRAARRRLLWHFPRLLPRLAWLALRAGPRPARRRLRIQPGYNPHTPDGRIRNVSHASPAGLAANQRHCRRELPCASRSSRRRTIIKLRSAYEGLLDLLDPSRLLARQQREQAEAARHAATAIKNERRAAERRAAERRKANAGPPAGVERRRAERRTRDRRTR